jgi:hypothetical protein
MNNRSELEGICCRRTHRSNKIVNEFQREGKDAGETKGENGIALVLHQQSDTVLSKSSLLGRSKSPASFNSHCQHAIH